MLVNATENDKAKRFREAVLPHLDSLYTVARYITRNAADAEDAVQECYLRAFRHFDGLRGSDIKPWLMAILRNVCRAEYARRSNVVPMEPEKDGVDHGIPLWQEERESPEGGIVRRQDAESVRAVLRALPVQFREVVVLRDIEDLSYREIAHAVDAPIGTVMSRLARGRGMLRAAWQHLQNGGAGDGQVHHFVGQPI
jgi:RNA polymerase sigma-70 factor (ECF subfamily)